MRPQELYRELAQGKIAPYYYLHGEELLAREACDQLIEKALAGGERSLNFQVFYGGEVEPLQVINCAQEFPFLSRRRVVLVKQAEKLKPKEQELYIPYLASPSPQTCLIFWAWEKLESKKINKEPLTSFIKQKGRLLVFTPLEEDETLSWIKNHVKARGYAITPEAAEFLMKNNEELLSLKNELDKVLLLAGAERTINLSHAEATAADFREADIYDLTKALGQGNYQEADKVLKKILPRSDDKTLLMIWGTVIGQWRKMIKAKELLEEGAGSGMVTNQMRMNPGLAADVKGISWPKLQLCLQEAAQIDLLWKRGVLKPHWAFYLLASRLCSATRKL